MVFNEKVKCLICGMMVHSKNYSFNGYSFIHKNEKDKIIHCPFCGVDKFYLDNNKEIIHVDTKTLDKETLDILDKAMKLEVFNGEFYEEASNLAKSKEICKTFKDLSNIEFMHAKIHQKLGSFGELPKLHKPNYTKYDTDQLLLEQAHKREKHAISFYSRNMKNVCSDVIKKIFDALSNVEKEHMIITK